MTKNTIYTIGQYIMEGFTAEEASLAREHDILHNEWVEHGELSDEKKARYFEIQKKLGL